MTLRILKIFEDGLPIIGSECWEFTERCSDHAQLRVLLDLCWLNCRLRVLCFLLIQFPAALEGTTVRFWSTKWCRECTDSRYKISANQTLHEVSKSLIHLTETCHGGQVATENTTEVLNNKSNGMGLPMRPQKGRAKSVCCVTKRASERSCCCCLSVFFI